MAYVLVWQEVSHPVDDSGWVFREDATAAASNSGMSGDTFEPVARVDEVPEEGTFPVVKSNGEPVCLIRTGGRITAVADNCTHQEFAMSLGDVLGDGTIQCAWHGARFDCATGAVVQGPATDPLPMFAVRIDDGVVLVGPHVDTDGEQRLPREAWTIAEGGPL